MTQIYYLTDMNHIISLQLTEIIKTNSVHSQQHVTRLKINSNSRLQQVLDKLSSKTNVAKTNKRPRKKLEKLTDLNRRFLQKSSFAFSATFVHGFVHLFIKMSEKRYLRLKFLWLEDILVIRLCQIVLLFGILYCLL